MIYSSVSSAVVAALAAGEKGAAKGQAWQNLYNAAEEEGGCLAMLGRDSSAIDRTQVDYWLSARIHHLLIPRHWNALVAKYSTNKGRRVQAISAIRPLIASPAPPLFIYKAVTAWAIPRLRGAGRKAPASVSVEIPIDAPVWRRDSMVANAIAAGQSMKQRVEGACQEVIILPKSFYDMNTWDLDANPESTRRRWRLDIHTKLDEMLDEALAKVAEILGIEGLLDAPEEIAS